MRLAGRGTAVGEAQWRVELIYEAPAPADSDAEAHRELITRNNQRDFTVELIDRPLRVLYVDGYPRWEYRYLKNLLIREKSIESSTLLLSADRDFAQEGDVPITRLPADAKELEPYDVIIIGDVPADYFTSQQIALLRDHVAVRGAALLWIGGSRNTPSSYAGTPLADLLPMRDPKAVHRLEAHEGQVRLHPTELARRLSVLALRPPPNHDKVNNITPGSADAANHPEADDTDWPRELRAAAMGAGHRPAQARGRGAGGHPAARR